MDHHEPFLEDIGANPEDDVPRLIYADWLDEQGDPRGEFIRVQCELARMPEDAAQWERLKEREQELYELYHHDWEIPFRQFEMTDWRFERGFVEAATVKLGGNVENIRTLFQKVPTIRELKCEGKRIQGVFSKVITSRFVEKLTHLDLSGCHLGGQLIKSLVTLAPLHNLVSLDLSYNHFGETPLEWVMNSGQLPSLRSLKLNGNPFSEPAIDFIAQSPLLGQLEELTLENIELNDLGLGRLSSSERLTSLRSLSLACNGITSEGMNYFARNIECPQLLCLSLWNNPIHDAGVAALAQSPTFSELQHLNLASCDLTREGLRSIVQSPYLQNLMSLSLYGFRFSDNIGYREREAHIQYLVQEPWFDCLQLIDVRDRMHQQPRGKLFEQFEGRLVSEETPAGWMLNYRSLL